MNVCLTARDFSSYCSTQILCLHFTLTIVKTRKCAVCLTRVIIETNLSFSHLCIDPFITTQEFIVYIEGSVVSISLEILTYFFCTVIVTLQQPSLLFSSLYLPLNILLFPEKQTPLAFNTFFSDSLVIVVGRNSEGL